MDDQELNQLLREWTAPEAPPDLRPRRARGSPLRWLITGTIRVPVPVALAVLLLAALWIASMRPGPMSTPETSGPRPSGELARHALTGPLDGFDAVLVELNFQPGVSVPEHRHPGPILGYVVNGQMRTAINHEPDQIVPAGGTFFEPHGALHTSFTSANPDAPVRAVAFLVVPSGSPLTERATTRREPTPQGTPLPYTAIHKPEFVAASEATLDKRLPARETVAGLEVGRDSVAYPFSELRIARVVNDRVGGLPIVIVHQPSSDTTTAFEARAKGKVLEFQAANDDASSVIDRQSRSTWDAYGLCLDGPLKGTQLKQVILVPQFWFAWSQFRPGTRVFTAR
jgi:quercetin dioxygenase-like cupin family protein